MAHREVILSLRKVLPPFPVSVVGLVAALGGAHRAKHVDALRR